MSLKATNLIIQMSQLPQTFRGTPNDLSAEMIRRMKILSPSGTNFIFVGDVEPASNVGPWLKDGTKWYVWDDSVKHYVPLDISDSETHWYFVGAEEPATHEPPLWIKTSRDATDQNPFFGDPLGFFFFNGNAWVQVPVTPLSGTSDQRPGTPYEFQQFYDETIQVLIWWERNAWRTVSGVPGDIKFVTYATLTEALTANPGWQELGNQDQSLRGRVLVQAAKDPGGAPQTVLAVGPGIQQRQAFFEFGENQQLNPATNSGIIYPPQLALWCLSKL